MTSLVTYTVSACLLLAGLVVGYITGQELTFPFMGAIAILLMLFRIASILEEISKKIKP